MYPIFVDLRGKKVLVVGGGSIAHAKVLGLLESAEDITLVSPQVLEPLVALAEQGRIKLMQRPYAPPEAADYFLTIAATDDTAVNSQVYDDAQTRERLVNVVDVPSLCGFYVPSVIKRGDLTVAISTGGAAPGIAKRLRRQLERLLPASYGPLLDELRGFRNKLRELLPDMTKRMAINSAIASDSAVDAYLKGKPQELRAKFTAEFAAHE